MSKAITKPTESQLRSMTRAVLIYARMLSATIGKVLVFRWPQKPFVRFFEDVQTATMWGTQADIYAAAYIGGEPISAGRGVGMTVADSSAMSAAPDGSGQSAGESNKVRSKKQGAARGYTKNMSAREIVVTYLASHPSDINTPVDTLVKKINKAARRKVGRTTVNDVQRMFRADMQRTETSKR